MYCAWCGFYRCCVDRAPLVLRIACKQGTIADHDTVRTRGNATNATQWDRKLSWKGWRGTTVCPAVCPAASQRHSTARPLALGVGHSRCSLFVEMRSGRLFRFKMNDVMPDAGSGTHSMHTVCGKISHYLGMYSPSKPSSELPRERFFADARHDVCHVMSGHGSAMSWGSIPLHGHRSPRENYGIKPTAGSSVKSVAWIASDIHESTTLHHTIYYFGLSFPDHLSITWEDL